MVSRVSAAELEAQGKIEEEPSSSLFDIYKLKALAKSILELIAILLDQYATFWDIVITSIGHYVIMLVNFFDTMPSFTEVVSAIFYQLPHFILSCIWTIVYFCFYVVTLPGRLFLYFLWNHPFIFIGIIGVLLMSVIFFIIFLKRLSVITVCQMGWEIIAPFAWTVLYSVLVYLFPPLGAAVAAIRLTLAPITKLLSFITILFNHLSPVRNWSRKRSEHGWQRRLPNSSPVLDSHLSQERILCCVCFHKEKSVLLAPCNHVCVCSECASKLNRDVPPHCPLCRAVVKSQTEVFI